MIGLPVRRVNGAALRLGSIAEIASPPDIIFVVVVVVVIDHRYHHDYDNERSRHICRAALVQRQILFPADLLLPLVQGRFADLADADVNEQALSCQRVISVHGEAAILDVGDIEGAAIARLVLHHDFGAQMTKLRRHIGNIVGEHEVRIVRAEAAIVGREFKLRFVTGALSFDHAIHSADQFVIAALNVGNRQIALFQNVARLITDAVGEGYELATADDVGHRWIGTIG